MKTVTLVKIGGNELADSGYLEAFAAALTDIGRESQLIVVHGGGRAVDELMARLGLTPQFVDGQRLTDEATLTVTEMVLCGQINKLLVRALNAAGLDALGLSGMDRGLLRVEPWPGLGRVGRVSAVRREALEHLLAAGVTPTIAPVSMGPEGAYNVNADHAAGAIAGTLGVDRAVFVSNVPGVRDAEGLASRLSRAAVEALIAQGVISGGMIPKAESALWALGQGARSVVITDLAGLRSGAGTTIVEG